MKKQFENILLRSGKKKRISILAGTIGIVMLLGVMTGCSAKESGSEEQQKSSEFPVLQTAQEETSEEKPADLSDNSEETLSEHGQEIKTIAEGFAEAYFSGNTDIIQSYLVDPYEWDIEVYEGLDATGAGTISELTWKGLTDEGKEENGSTEVISLEFRDSNYEDMFLYLTIELIRQEDGWKIQFYGLEG